MVTSKFHTVNIIINEYKDAEANNKFFKYRTDVMLNQPTNVLNHNASNIVQLNDPWNN